MTACCLHLVLGFIRLCGLDHILHQLLDTGSFLSDVGLFVLDLGVGMTPARDRLRDGRTDNNA